MPLTLAKLFSPTLEASFEFLDETVHVTWAPMRYTGEMQEFALRIQAESDAGRAEVGDLREKAAALIAEAETLADGGALRAQALEVMVEAESRETKLQWADRAALRDILSRLLVTWDVLDGKTPIPTDIPSLTKLPDPFLWAVFASIFEANQPDPTPAPRSDGTASTDPISAPSPTGTTTSPRRARSASRRSSSTRGQNGHATTLSGGIGA